MIGQDRIELNNRFINVFSILENKGIIVKNDRNGKGMGDFADKILGNRGYGHIIRAFLNKEDKRCFDYKHIDKLCEAYKVNRDYMIHGIGEPFGRRAKRQLDEVSVPTASKGNILYTSVQAFAGATIEAGGHAAEDHSFFTIPDMPNSDYVAFTIEGNSMDPLIKFGDIVICESVGNVDKIHNNEIYAVKSKDSVWIKYVQKITNNRGRVTHLKLISENKLEHDPFVEEVNEYTRLYKVTRLISSL